MVGGSLVAAGGHNLLEPAAGGLPVLFGRHTDNFAPVAERLLAAGGGLRVADAGALEAAVLRLAREPGEREAGGLRAREVVAGGAGAVARTVELLTAALKSAESAGGR